MKYPNLDLLARHFWLKVTMLALVRYMERTGRPVGRLTRANGETVSVEFPMSPGAQKTMDVINDEIQKQAHAGNT